MVIEGFIRTRRWKLRRFEIEGFCLETLLRDEILYQDVVMVFGPVRRESYLGRYYRCRIPNAHLTTETGRRWNIVCMMGKDRERGGALGRRSNYPRYVPAYPLRLRRNASSSVHYTKTDFSLSKSSFFIGTELLKLV